MNPRNPVDNGGEERITSKVVRAVAAYADEPPDELPPLYEVVDPDALEAVFAPTDDGAPRTNGRIVFEYGGHRVTVTAGGTVEVDPLVEPL